LYYWLFVKSNWNDRDKSDFEIGVIPNIILSSSANRAKKTAQGIQSWKDFKIDKYALEFFIYPKMF